MENDIKIQKLKALNSDLDLLYPVVLGNQNGKINT